jgi:small subunit ribosomal protein S16
MVKIRLTQTGKKNAKTYRIVVLDSRVKRNGRVLDTLGHYNPIPDLSEMKLDIERADKWIAQGAQMSPRVTKIYDLVKNNKVQSK